MIIVPLWYEKANEQSQNSTSPAATTSDKIDMQQRKRPKKTLAVIRIATNVPRAQHPARLSVGDMMLKMSHAAWRDAIREGFYWGYVPITVGWCNYGEDESTRFLRNMLDASGGLGQ